MKNRQKAFTLIELLVAVTIIWIVSFTWVFWFIKFAEENSLKLKTNQILTQIDTQDQKVTNKQIFDYKIIFDSNNNSSYYIYENIIWEEVKQLVKNSNSWSLQIELKWNFWNNWYTSVYKEHKLDLSKKVWVQEYSISVENWYDYRIIWTLSWTTDKTILNNVLFKNIDKEESEINIQKITDTEWWNNINHLEITNIWWRKKLTSSWSTINEAFIYFDKNWTESFINIKK